MAGRARDILVRFLGDEKDLVRSSKSVETSTGRIGKAFDSIKANAKLMAAGAVAGLVAMAKAAGENADRLFDLQSQTGASTETLQEYEYVAKAAGASQEFFSDAVKQVVKNLDEEEGATGAAGDALERLGVATKNANGSQRSAVEITEDAIARLAAMKDVTARNALAQDIFGKKWEETIAVLDIGSDAIKDLRGEAHEMGAVLSTAALAGADRLRETTAKLSAALGGQILENLGLLAAGIGGAFGDEASADALAFSEAVDAVVKQIEDGVQPEDVFANGLLHIAEAGELSTEEFEQLAAAAGLALEEMDADTLRRFGDLLYAQAIAAGASAEAAGEVRNKFSVAAIEMDIANGVIQEQHDSWRLLHPEIRTATEALEENTQAEIDSANTKLAALSPTLATLRAVEANRKAHEALTEAGKEGTATQAEITELQLEARIAFEQAKIAIAQFGEVSATSMAEFAEATGISVQEAANLYLQLGLLDGTTAAVNIVTNYIERGGKVRENEVGNELGEDPYRSPVLSNVASFDADGLVPGPTGKPMPAIVHGGELVLTPAQRRRSSGHVVQNFYNTYTVNGGADAARRELVERDRALRRLDRERR